MDENTKSKLLESRTWIREELERCIGFWLNNGMDPVNGGVYTCLDREGKVFSTDKSVWMQGRCGWIFSWLCHLYGAKDEWLQAAKSCLDFMEAHCINREAGDRMYFTVTADGRPLRQRRYCFSEAFYAMANAELPWQMPSTMALRAIGTAFCGPAEPMISIGISTTVCRIPPASVPKLSRRPEAGEPSASL